ncbi:hypothetical protein [Alicyclobacillus acidocaldarius]|uniref:Cold-shock DNA-binding domain protein n=1 Tax=Alicyclobacillus acidocaldarius subsp. acidocaldarius (strain ATCC 27009 / DSM 446 / BCRC 14685 / JCM 5260 / KCTC 1825 / NBRC 15652 / NCIMB 11725 / NRRL B-14509 / 104-IA) TaxID=521098 RepID=C8WT73_ALIAD|nr:hypothetical protein [Alicyclobacillus acidocaldarius]ACV59587.1 hypothetical protein Aaci_2583 [Alicyclobacillus acidocaldarius subsp. acidocaldarius DSM 446]
MQRGVICFVHPNGRQGVLRVRGGWDLPFDAADCAALGHVRPGDHVAFDVMQTPEGPVAYNLIRRR